MTNFLVKHAVIAGKLWQGIKVGDLMDFQITNLCNIHMHTYVHVCCAEFSSQK